jgi:hypothetical protein
MFDRVLDGGDDHEDDEIGGDPLLVAPTPIDDLEVGDPAA